MDKKEAQNNNKGTLYRYIKKQNKKLTSIELDKWVQYCGQILTDTNNKIYLDGEKRIADSNNDREEVEIILPTQKI